MKTAVKITFLAVLTVLLGTTVCVYAVLAPSTTPLLPRVQQPIEISLGMNPGTVLVSDVAPLIPLAQPVSSEQDLQTQNLFLRSA